MFQQTTVSLDRLFSDIIYRVPEYQRAYSWTRKQLDDLWEDLEESFVSTTANHFMGTLILERAPDGSIRKGLTNYATDIIMHFVDEEVRQSRNIKIKPNILRKAHHSAIESQKRLGEWLKEAIEEKIK